MSLIARLLYCAAVILVLFGVLVLIKAIHGVSATWVGLFIGAGVCAIIGYFLDGAPRSGPRI